MGDETSGTEGQEAEAGGQAEAQGQTDSTVPENHGDDHGKGRSLPDAFKARRWRPGESGNLKGRPRSALCLSDLLRHELDEVPPVLPDGSVNVNLCTWGQLIVQALLHRATNGDIRAIDLILTRLEGRVPETIFVQRFADEIKKLVDQDVSSMSLSELARYEAELQAMIRRFEGL